MQIPVLVEPVANHGLRKAGEPLPLSADGATPDEAVRNLRAALYDQLKNRMQHNGASFWVASRIPNLAAPVCKFNSHRRPSAVGTPRKNDHAIKRRLSFIMPALEFAALAVAALSFPTIRNSHGRQRDRPTPDMDIARRHFFRGRLGRERARKEVVARVREDMQNGLLSSA